MGGKSKNSVYFSIQCSNEEKAQLDKLVKAAGTNRNNFIRQLIARLASKPAA